METHPFTYSSSHFGKLGIDPARTVGRGGALAPTIHFAVSAEFGAIVSRTDSYSILVHALTGQAVIDHAGGFALDVIASPIQRLFAAEPTPQHVELFVRLNQSQLEAIEAGRKNRDVGVTLQLRLSFQVLAKIGAGVQTGFQVPHVVVDAAVAPLFVSFKIPQSTWVNEVLSQVGFGQVLMFEFPAYPVGALLGLGESFEAAKRAHQQFNAGEYPLSGEWVLLAPVKMRRQCGHSSDPQM